MKTMKLRFLSILRWSGVFGQQHIPNSVQCRCRTASSTVVGQEGCDVAVVGGGIMGLSSAYFIKQMNPDARVCVLERDPQYKIASTPLSVASVRQQFSLKENIHLSMWSFQFLQSASRHLTVPGEDEVDIQLFQAGYLFLASEKGKATLKENYDLQKSVGAAVEWLDQQQLRTKYPWLSVEGLRAGVLGVQNEGWFDPWALLFAFKKKAASLGVQYIEGTVTGMEVTDERVESVQVAQKDGRDVVLPCRHLVNAAGPWAGQVARLAGIGDPSHSNPTMHVPLPVTPRKRMVFVFHCPDGPAGVVPLTVDPSGMYFRSEGSGKDGMYICGKSPDVAQDRDGEALEVDYEFFDEHLWPALAHRVPAFEGLKLRSAWAGYYDYNTFDQNSIIGLHPVLRNLIFINGFSGHGLQQAPAAGRAVAEMITHRQWRSSSVDVEKLGFRRIVHQLPLLERNIV